MHYSPQPGCAGTLQFTDTPRLTQYFSFGRSGASRILRKWELSIQMVKKKKKYIYMYINKGVHDKFYIIFTVHFYSSQITHQQNALFSLYILYSSMMAL
jgi:hypothetical protein